MIGLVPVVQRWRDREARIEQARQRLFHIHQYVTSAPLSHQTPPTTARGSAPQALRGRTAALAAAQLQAMLQQYADLSHFSVSRLDVTEGNGASAAPQDSLMPFPVIPGTLSGIGDIYGVAGLLDRIQHGPRVLEVTELSIVQNAVYKGGLMQLTLAVRGPWITH